jgi:uncharacterized SAM-binding protein YcdF (DUF218 family)
MTFLRWIFSLTVLTVWCGLIGTGLFVAMYEDPTDIEPAQAIVVLGGNEPENGELTGETAKRLTRGMALYDDGIAPLLVATGGGPVPAAPVMAAKAVATGASADSLLIEDQAQSTLQNALFTSDFEALDKTQPIILVTHRYHLPRAWASFRWAGFQNVQGIAADPEDGFSLSLAIVMESIKWPVNVVRAAAASVAIAGDVPRENFLKYLE